MTDRRHAGFKRRTRLAAARDRLREVVTPIGRTHRVPLGSAAGRVVTERIEAKRDVPHYRRAAMDGYAVRAEDTFGASARAPAVLRRTEGALGPGEAARVHTGSELPDDADAVVMIERVDEVGTEVEVVDAVPVGEHVAPVGEDVSAGTALFEPGHRLRPSDLGLLAAAGRDAVEVVDAPTVGIVPTGSELVATDPGPGEAVETNGLTVALLVDRWGGAPTRREIVSDEPAAIRSAVQRDLTKDLVVTTGGSSVGARDRVPDVIAELGDVPVHGVAIKPGHPAAIGVVDDTPVLALPGYPVSCIVTAMQLLRPAVRWAGRLPFADPPAVPARLGRKIESEPGVRTFARVEVDERDGERVAVPTSADGAGVLSSVALADGWVEVPESREGVPEGETVSVQDWERLP